MSENQSVSVEGTVPAVKTRKNIPAAKFITAWETSNSTKEVAEKLGLDPAKSVNSLSARASKMRTDKGLALKILPKGGGPRVDLDAMKALIASLSGVEVSEVEARGQKLLEATAARKAERAQG